MRSLSWPRAVRMTIGTGASARSRRHTSRPSMPGEHEVEHHQVGRVGQRPVERRPAVGHRLDLVAVAARGSAPPPRTRWRRRRRRGSAAGVSITAGEGTAPGTRSPIRPLRPGGTTGAARPRPARPGACVHRRRGPHRARQGAACPGGSRPGCARRARPPGGGRWRGRPGRHAGRGVAVVRRRVVLALDGRPGRWCPPGVRGRRPGRRAARPTGWPPRGRGTRRARRC